MNIPARSQFKAKHERKQSRKFVHNRRRRIIWGCTLGVISVTSWLFVTSALIHLAVFDIHEINIQGADGDITNTLQASAIQVIQGDYLGLFSKSSFFTYSKSAIEQALKKSDARVNDVIVSRRDFHSLDVMVHGKIPGAVVCTNLPNWNGSLLTFDSLDSCYLVDDTGFIFMKATTSSVDINRYYIPNLVDLTPSSSIIGTRAASTTMFRTLQSFYNSALLSGIDVKALLVKGAGEYELYAETKSGIVVIYFNEINGFENELTALVSFWNDVSQKARIKGEILQLDSIDLRYGSNVFYRVVK